VVRRTDLGDCDPDRALLCFVEAVLKLEAISGLILALDCKLNLLFEVRVAHRFAADQLARPHFR
jgi:hypothetical protein